MAKGKLGYKVRTIECVSCGKSVTGHMREGQKYCSLECYRSSARPQRKTGEERQCTFCGEPVYIRASQLKKSTNFFCSLAHQIEWQGRNKDTYTCKTCGEEFKWSPSRKKHTTPTYCTPACRDADPSRRDKLIQMNVDQMTDKFNKLERAGYEMLDSIGVAYDKQALLFGKFCVDAVYPQHKVVVQFDGDYWHGHPEKFPNPDERQRRRMWVDRGQDAYLAKAGYTVVRIWEADIKASKAAVLERVSSVIHAASPVVA